MADQTQAEFEFDVREEWERKLLESAQAYAAFCAFRDLGPKRTLRGAHRALTGADGHGADASGYPGSWRRWINIWQWLARATAFDLGKERQRALEIQELRHERLKQRLELDRDFHLPQIIALNKKIDELITTSLAKTTSVNQQTGLTNSLDRARAFELMAAERRALEEAYFSPSQALLDPKQQSTADKEQPVPLVGKFEWVRDPEVPDLPDVPPVEAFDPEGVGGKGSQEE